MSILVIRRNDREETGPIRAADLKTLQICQRSGDSDFFMRVRPVSFMLNSTLVQENLNKGNPLVLNMNNGNVYFIKPTEGVWVVDKAKLEITI